MREFIAKVFRKRPLEIYGAFVGQTPEGSTAFIKAHVIIEGAMWPFDVTFHIDTASHYTVLLDNDFLTACEMLGWRPRRDIDILNWVRTQPNLFGDEGPALTVGGVTGSIYRINHSCLRYYLPEGEILERWRPRELPVYGSFSGGFAQGISPPHHSLLGIDKLNELRQFLWSWPRSTVRLTP